MRIVFCKLLYRLISNKKWFSKLQNIMNNWSQWEQSFFIQLRLFEKSMKTMKTESIKIKWLHNWESHSIVHLVSTVNTVQWDLKKIIALKQKLWNKHVHDIGTYVRTHLCIKSCPAERNTLKPSQNKKGQKIF